jgi:hypothetical protein
VGRDLRTEELRPPAHRDAAEDQKGGEYVKNLIAEKVAFDDAEDGSRSRSSARRSGRSRFRWSRQRALALRHREGRSELLKPPDRVLRAADARLGSRVRSGPARVRLTGHDGNPKAYAQRLRSTEGHQDGLFWPAAEGEVESPLGDLLGNATFHALDDPSPQPFQGYWFRILKAQGENAPGGARTTSTPRA